MEGGARRTRVGGAGGAGAGALALLAWAAGCSAGAYSARAEDTARELIRTRGEETLGTREMDAVQPLSPDEVLAPGPPHPVTSPAEPTVLDLRAALATAFDSSRTMLTRREVLEAQGLSLSTARHAYSPQLALALSYLFDDFPGNPDAQVGGASFSASQILPTGGTLSVDAATGAVKNEGEATQYDSLVGITLAQPLLRGGGYDVSHEALIQAERNLVYELRDFELFREDFSIEVARRYYDLVNQKQSIENQRRNLESNEFARRQAEALFAVGRANELDVLRARRSELTALNTMLEAEESLELALDQFRIFLGLPESEPVDVLDDAPPFTPVDYELQSAIEVAMVNRLDLLNRRQQLEDVERGVRIARDGLLPDLDLRLGAIYSSEPSGDFGGDDFDRANASAALTLDVPIDRVRERNAYRAAQLDLSRARRDLNQFEDELQVGIKRSFRELARRLASLDIQRQLIEDQTKNLRIAEIRFERGEIPNRDVVEANQSLLDAQNALIDEQVGYEIARLELLRELGILFIDRQGMWKG